VYCRASSGKCCFILSMSTVSGLLEVNILSVMVDRSQNKIMLADSGCGSSLYP